jgi:hypothetical protein
MAVTGVVSFGFVLAKRRDGNGEPPALFIFVDAVAVCDGCYACGRQYRHPIFDPFCGPTDFRLSLSLLWRRPSMSHRIRRQPSYSLYRRHHSEQGESVNKLCAGDRSAISKAVSLLIFGTCLCLSGCRSSHTIWSSEARSPDGKLVASARTVVRNPGLAIISGVDTDVYLNWSKDSRSPMLILDLADGSDAANDTGVEMKWLTPTHLEVTYRGNRSIGFQAVKWAGVDISVRELTSAASKPSK